MARLNGADEIELEVATGTVPYEPLSKVLKGFGVARKLLIPRGADTDPQDGALSDTASLPTMDDLAGKDAKAGVKDATTAPQGTTG